jgi:hypothetical protein
MRTVVIAGLALFTLPALVAQAPPTAQQAPAQTPAPKSLITDAYPITPPIPVSLSNEPHHALILQNSYVRVYDVNVPPLDATLLHRHDLPYIYVVLGPADFVNAVTGKPEAHIILDDGATRYSPGGFSHVTRTDAGIPFHNITVELVHPQAEARNICEKMIEGPLGACPQVQSDPPKNWQIPFELVTPYFDTSEVHVDMVQVEGGKEYSDAAPANPALLIALSQANLDVALGGLHAAFLHAGDVLWLPPSQSRRVGDFLGTRSSFLIISFKDFPAPAAAK